MRITFFLILLIICSSFEGTSSERLLQPYNLDFEDGVSGELPKGWNMALKFEKSGFKAGTYNKESLRGKNCLNFTFTGIIDTTQYQDSMEVPEDSYGYVYQSIDASDYRNKKVKFKAAILTENLNDSSICRLRITSHFTQGKESKNIVSDSIKAAKGWMYYEITADIDDDASLLNFGVLLSGSGYLLIDDASFEFVQEDDTYNELDRSELSLQNIENLTAFIKIFGNVRYFYPNSETLNFDWDKFALTGVEFIEQAQNREELIESLNKLFLPLAPGIQIKDNDKFASIDKPKDAIDNVALSWVHIGAKLEIPITGFSNELHNIYLPTRKREAPAIQIIDAMPLRGKMIRFSAFVKTKIHQPDGHAQLWLGIDNSKEQLVIFNSTINQKPIIDANWTKYSVEAEVPMDASIIRLGLVMLGDGKVGFDNATLHVIEKNKETGRNFVKNPDFEDGEVGGFLLGWTFPESANKAGYACKTVNHEQENGKNCLEINSDDKTRIEMPKLNEYINFKPINGIFVNMPLNAFVDSVSTLPKQEIKNEPVRAYKPDNFIINSKDRYSRFAVTAILWNVYRHFAIGIDVKLNWDAILVRALKNAASDANENFIVTVNRMLAEINDGQGRAWSNTNTQIFGLPVLWRWVGNELVVYQTADTINAIPLGSIVRTINGQKIEDLVITKLEAISGNTEKWKKLRAAAELRSGNQDDTLSIEVLTPENGMKVYSMLKNADIFSISENRPPQFHIISENDYYLDLTRITERGLKNIVNEFKDRLPKANTMIFDLRGFTSLSEEFLGMFLNNKVKSVSRKSPVFTKPNGTPCTFLETGSEIAPKNPFVKTNVFWLIDERTSGAAEIIAGIAKKYKIGKLIGGSTSGTADEVLGINLPGEFNASMVCMLVDLGDDKINFKKGIEPDIEINPTIEGIAKGSDETLDYIYGLLKK